MHLSRSAGTSSASAHAYMMGECADIIETPRLNEGEYGYVVVVVMTCV